MAMQKKGDSEKISVLRGREATILQVHMQRTGKQSVGDFDETEMAELQSDLANARRVDEQDREQLAKAMEEELPPRKLVKPVDTKQAKTEKAESDPED